MGSTILNKLSAGKNTKCPQKNIFMLQLLYISMLSISSWPYLTWTWSLKLCTYTYAYTTIVINEKYYIYATADLTKKNLNKNLLCVKKKNTKKKLYLAKKKKKKKKK